MPTISPTDEASRAGSALRTGPALPPARRRALSRTEPSETPSDIPRFRPVAVMAEASPSQRRGTADICAVLLGAWKSPAPRPITRNAPSIGMSWRAEAAYPATAYPAAPRPMPTAARYGNRDRS